MSLHINEEPFEKSMRVLNLKSMKFEEIEVKEFDEKYKQHELDTREPFWKKFIQEAKDQKMQYIEEEQTIN